MQFRLKVIGGKNDGREIEIKSEFLIGRGDGVNLRPRSDLISRHHCKLFAENGRAYVKDLDSRNGTYVNGERIKGQVQLDLSDRVRIGRLQFEVILDHAKPGAKKPKVIGGVKEAAAREATGSSSGSFDMDESITDWLTEAAETEKTEQQAMMETRQFRLDDTDNAVLGSTTSTVSSEDESKNDSSVVDESENKDDSTIINKKKQKPGKLPEQKKQALNDSKEAAQDMLRKFFNRR